MSIPHSELRCDKCDYTGTTLSLQGRLEYKLDSGIRLDLPSSTGWCDECGTVVSIESLDWKSIRKWLMYLQQEYQDYWFWQRKEKKLKQYEIDDYTDLLNIVASRSDGPRCLFCGSHNVIYLGTTSGFKHPHCGGTIIATESDIRFYFSPTVTLYSQDGSKIETIHVDHHAFYPMNYSDWIREENAKIRINMN